MPIRVVEIHHHAIRIDDGAAALAANLDFYQGLLGLTPDTGRPDLRGVPGFWINVGETGQLHLIGGPVPSPFAQGPGQQYDRAASGRSVPVPGGQPALSKLAKCSNRA